MITLRKQLMFLFSYQKDQLCLRLQVGSFKPNIKWLTWNLWKACYLNSVN